MIKFVNLTQHTVNLNSGESFPGVPKEEWDTRVPRVSQEFSSPDENGIVDATFGEIKNLPPYEDGVLLIVSGFVLGAAKEAGRDDCVAPATGHPDTVRNEKGHVVSVPHFMR